MRRALWTAAFLAVLALALSACGSGSGDDSQATSDQAAEQQEEREGIPGLPRSVMPMTREDGNWRLTAIGGSHL